MEASADGGDVLIIIIVIIHFIYKVLYIAF